MLLRHPPPFYVRGACVGQLRVQCEGYVSKKHFATIFTLRRLAIREAVFLTIAREEGELAQEKL